MEPLKIVIIRRGLSEEGSSSEDTDLSREVGLRVLMELPSLNRGGAFRPLPLTVPSLDPRPDHSNLTDTSSKVALTCTVVRWDKDSLTGHTSHCECNHGSQGQSNQKHLATVS